MLQSTVVKLILAISLLLTPAYAQTFDAVSIRLNPPRTGFHFTTDSGSGGPGTADPGIFRCSECTLATLIAKAFDLRDYQFPEKSSLAENTFELMARIPAGATREDFLAMMQNMLKDRFALTWHFKDKTLNGYHLVIAKGGSKLKESADNATNPAADPNQHVHSGLVNWGPTSRYNAGHQTAADLARLLSDQLSQPVEDQTGLHGLYDISLSWSGNGDHSASHVEGAFGGAGHGDHGGATIPSNPGDPTGPSLFEAVQSQLGLKLTASGQTTAKIFVIDHVEHLPTAN